MASNPRGFNRGRYFGKNQWRGGFRARNNYRNNVRNRGSHRAKLITPTRDGHDFAAVSSNGDDLDDTTLTDDRPRSISSRPITNKNTSPYAGWNYYFHDDDYKTSVEIVRKVKAVENFIDQHRNLYSVDEIEERRSCIFDLRILLADDELLNNWPTFRDDLVSNLSNTLNCLGLAIYQTVWESVKEESCMAENDLIDVPMIRARVINFDCITQLKDIKSKCFGKTVSVHGTVIRVSNVRLRCSWLAFQCIGCETIQCVKLEDGIVTQPTSCLDRNCRLRTFTPLRMSKYTQTIDWQTIKLQEMAPNEGRVSKTIECELLENDLVNSCSPGDIVTIIGTVKIRSVEENVKKTNGPSMSTFYVEAAGLVNSTSMHVGDANGGYTPTVQFVQKDYDAIHEIKSTPDLFKLLVHSLCPTIYGHEMVKAGLLLALFGGSQGDGMETRGESHVLVVGDPGLGKSQMLQACSLIAPRGVFVCGNTTTSSGLTVTLTRDGGGDYSLEAGALVLADQGCCCIDEFDKMSSQHQSLLEAMELQTVSIAKAGVMCQLPARTSVLAAANPVGGHYNKGKTVSENLRMDYRLLSRFDLVFILLDKPNKYLDALLSDHVLKTHSGLSKEQSEINVEELLSLNHVSKDGGSLSTRLKGKTDEELDLIPSQLLRKYIAYARKFIPTVTLSNDARKVLQQFYLQSRENYHISDSTPVTTRQLRSLLRLTQARAKIELREEATLSDALDVIEIVKSSLLDTLPEELHFSQSREGASMSKKNQVKRFLMALHKKGKNLGRSLFDYSEMKDIARQAQMDVSDFSSFVTTLNDQGYLLKKGDNKYQLQSID